VRTTQTDDDVVPGRDAKAADLAQGLEGASDADLAAMEILGNGYGLHWPSLDVDLAVPDLMAGLLGTRSWMARKAGSTTSKAKAKAARENGKKGGRPRQAARGKTLKWEVSPWVPGDAVEERRRVGEGMRVGSGGGGASGRSGSTGLSAGWRGCLDATPQPAAAKPRDATTRVTGRTLWCKAGCRRCVSPGCRNMFSFKWDVQPCNPTPTCFPPNQNVL
jgi:hypothetical protein